MGENTLDTLEGEGPEAPPERKALRPFAFDELSAILPFQRFRVEFEQVLRTVVQRLALEGKLQHTTGDLRPWQEELGRSGCRLDIKGHPERSLFAGLRYAPDTIYPGMADLIFAIDLAPNSPIQLRLDSHGEEIREVARQLSSPAAGVFWAYNPGGTQSLLCLCSFADIACTANQPESIVRFFRHAIGSLAATGLTELYFGSQEASRKEEA